MNFENAFSDIDAGKVSKVEEENEVQDKVFIRDDSDNKLFPTIQVKDPVKEGIFKDETIGVADFDTPVFRIAQQMETKYLYVECVSDKRINAELKNKTEFKGRGKKVSESSWLGLLNTEREVAGLEPLKVEDFSLEEKQKLKYDEDKAMEQAKILVYKKIKQYKQQYQLKTIKLLLGEGSTFRDLLPTVRPYKGNRVDSLRPLLLKKLRKWCVDELGAELPTKRYDGNNIECDDLCEHYKAKSYQCYRKNGWFPYVLLSSDKDSLNSAGCVINPDLYSGEDNPLKGKFKFPQVMVIEATDLCTGDLELVSTTSSPELKGYGFKFLLAQAHLNQDSADNYDALGHLKDSGYNMNFGVQSAYKVLKPCKTVQECLQKTIDTFAELLPYGVQYTDCHKVAQDIDTMSYMNTYFLVAYMTRSYDDKMDFYKLCKAFKVDTSAIVNNNEWTPPYEVFNTEGAEELTKKVVTSLDDTLLEDFKAYKSLKKDDVVGKHSSAEEKIKLIREDLLDKMYITVQRNKKTGEIRTVTKETANDE